MVSNSTSNGSSGVSNSISNSNVSGCNVNSNSNYVLGSLASGRSATWFVMIWELGTD